jgi:hypothetical protein
MEARKRTLLSQRERRDDTRRKILIGAWVLAQVERGENVAGGLAVSSESIPDPTRRSSTLRVVGSCRRGRDAEGRKPTPSSAGSNNLS